MAAFLSGLMVLSSHLSQGTDTQRFLGHLLRRTQFPPALHAMAYILKKLSIYDEQKTALATTFFSYLKKLIPETGTHRKFQWCVLVKITPKLSLVTTDESKLFESSIPGLSFLVSFVMS